MVKDESHIRAPGNQFDRDGTHLEKWPKYTEMGMVKVSYEVFKVPGELVLYCEHLQTVKYRDPAALKTATETGVSF